MAIAIKKVGGVIPVAVQRRMSAKAKRIAVAKEVLMLLRRRKIAAQQGAYIHSPNVPFAPLQGIQNDTEMRDVILSRKCQVCGIGAIACARATLLDAMPANHVISDDAMDMIGRGATLQMIGEVFSRSQVDLIETAFEKYLPGDIISGPSTESQASARKFGLKYRSATARLKAIMRNIIRNGGKFVP